MTYTAFVLFRYGRARQYHVETAVNLSSRPRFACRLAPERMAMCGGSSKQRTLHNIKVPY